MLQQDKCRLDFKTYFLMVKIMKGTWKGRKGEIVEDSRVSWTPQIGNNV